MRNFKKFLTLALAVLMVVSTFAIAASAANFTDVDPNDEYLAKSVNLLSYLNVTKGTSETTFGTTELVTREQMAAFIYRFMKKGNSVENGANTSTFTDLEDPTFFFMISWANNQGIIKGTSATTFEPKGSIILQDAYTMIVRALGYETEESLPYPFGYIEIAESKGVELNKGLPSNISYTDALTRGNVAILLYNAFFAETGVAETKQEEKRLGNAEDGYSFVLQTVTEYPTFCEKYFDVLEVEYQAIGTPNCAFEDGETTNDLGYDAILFRAPDDNENPAEVKTNEFYADVKDLAIDGAADEYIMSYFKMYVTLDKDDAIDEILYAEPLLTKKSVKDIKLESLSSNKKGSYYTYDYNGEEYNGAKHLSGKALMDGEAVYFFNAPYSYTQPTYAAGYTDAQKYAARNEKNINFINIELYEANKTDSGYKVTVQANPFSAVNDDEFFTDDSTALINAMTQVYTGGLYGADIYDVDGDGIYDYINYRPYSFAVVDTTTKKTFYKDGVKNGGADEAPTVYTNKAVATGASFADEDFVIGYFNKKANLIEIAAVVKPVVGAVKDISDANKTIVLSNGDKVSTSDVWKLVENYNNKAALEARGYLVSKTEFHNALFENLTRPAAYDSKDAEYYVYNGVVLFSTGVESVNDFDGTLMIITEDEENDGKWYDSNFNNKTGKKTTYVHAWIEGELVYVPVVTDAYYPEIKTNENTYVNKIASYSVDGSGNYSVKLLANAYDDEDMDAIDYVGLEKDIAKVLAAEKDETYFGIIEVGVEAKLTKDLGKRFTLTGVDQKLYLDETTKVVLKNLKNGEIKFEELGLNDLTGELAGLNNVQLVVKNDPDHNNALKLVVLYAEGEDLDVEDSASKKKAERIVKLVDVVPTDDDEYMAKYQVYNPYTGAVETTYGSTTASKAASVKVKAYGDMVTVTSTGKVDENAKSQQFKDMQKYWVLSYDPDDDTLEICPYGDLTSVYYVNAEKASVVRLGSDTKWIEDVITWGSMSALNKADLADDDNDAIRCYNKSYTEDDGATYSTKYAKYVKATMLIDWEKDDDHFAKDEDGFNGDLLFAVVWVMDGETQELDVD